MSLPFKDKGYIQACGSVTVVEVTIRCYGFPMHCSEQLTRVSQGSISIWSYFAMGS